MKAFLLAGGHGTRLRPLTDHMPKCLMPICGQPLLEIWLEVCRRAGIDEVLINLHAHASAIEGFLRAQNHAIKVQVVHEKHLLGSAGTLAANRGWVESEAAFWVLYADVLTNMNLRKMSEFHAEQNQIATLGVCQVLHPSSCGVIELDAEGLVVGFEEKPENPRSSLAFSGVMLAARELLDWIPATLPADIGFHVLPRLLGRMAAYPIPEYLLDIGTMTNYEKAQKTWPGLAEPREQPGTPRYPPVHRSTEPAGTGGFLRTRGIDSPSLELLPPRQLRGVVFDMDGVLVDSHAAHRRAWRVFLETLHRQVQDSELDYILDGRKRIDILRHFLGDLPAADLDEFGRRKDSIFRQIQLAVSPLPGVVRLVRELRQGGARLAVATSASRSRAGSTLAELGLLDCFEAVVTGEEAARGKPDPAIYRLASDRLGIPPRDLLAVEDAVSGVQAAVAAGLACVALSLHKAPEALRAAGAAYVISGFENVSWNDLEGVLLARPAIIGDARRAANPVKR